MATGTVISSLPELTEYWRLLPSSFYVKWGRWWLLCLFSPIAELFPNIYLSWWTRLT